MFALKKLSFWLKALLISSVAILASSAYGYFSDSGSNQANVTGNQIPNTNAMAKQAPQNNAKEMAQQLEDQINGAQNGMFANYPEINTQLSTAKKDIASNNDLGALQAISKIENIANSKSLTAGQKELLSELLVHTQSLVLTRNFSNNPQIAGPVFDAINAVQQREPGKAVTSLNEIASRGELSPYQHELVKSMLGEYGNDYGQASDMKNGVMDHAKSITDLF